MLKLATNYKLPEGVWHDWMTNGRADLAMFCANEAQAEEAVWEEQSSRRQLSSGVIAVATARLLALRHRRKAIVANGLGTWDVSWSWKCRSIEPGH
jgi:hypothetical protein